MEAYISIHWGPQSFSSAPSHRTWRPTIIEEVDSVQVKNKHLCALYFCIMNNARTCPMQISYLCRSIHFLLNTKEYIQKSRSIKSCSHKFFRQISIVVDTLHYIYLSLCSFQVLETWSQTKSLWDGEQHSLNGWKVPKSTPTIILPLFVASFCPHGLSWKLSTPTPKSTLEHSWLFPWNWGFEV